jgi:hypothetical protein
MTQTRLTRERLTVLLAEAKVAHAAYERQIGERHDDWPSWYADYILTRLEREPVVDPREPTSAR